MADGGPVVAARGLSWAVRSRSIVEAVDLELPRGEVLALIGPNGAGKSTLLLLLAGLIRPTAGTVTIQGTPAHEVALSAAGRIGLITADVGLYPLLSGWENLTYFGGLFGLSAAEVRERATPVLEELDVAAELDRPVSALSSGMKQKISLARALLMDPVLLLLDEPTANLDPVATRTLHEAVRAQADRGVAIVLCTHNLHAAEQICDQVAVMEQTLRFRSALADLPEPDRLYTVYADHVEAR